MAALSFPRRFMALRARRGFSLIELFIVVLIIGILTTLALPRVRDFRHCFFKAAMLSDLRNLAATEEAYWSTVDQYTNDLTALRFEPTKSVTITFVEADSVGWSAKASHASDTTTCAVYYGKAAILPRRRRRRSSPAAIEPRNPARRGARSLPRSWRFTPRSLG